MRKLLLSASIVAMAFAAMPTNAAAIDCPAVIDGDPYDRQYTLNTASGCVFGTGNINGANNDDFLDDTYVGSNGTVPDLSQFTSGTSSGSASGGAATAGNLTFESDGDWTLTGAVSGTTYAIGIVDGTTPKWAVFFVTATTDGTLSGTWSIQKCEGPCANPNSGSYGVLTTDRTALSHIVLYTGGAGTGGGGTGGGGTGGGGTGGGGTPEPASLALFGLGLLGAGYRFRRRTV